MTSSDLGLLARLGFIAFVVLLVIVLELAEQLWRTRRRRRAAGRRGRGRRRPDFGRTRFVRPNQTRNGQGRWLVRPEDARQGLQLAPGCDEAPEGPTAAEMSNVASCTKRRKEPADDARDGDRDVTRDGSGRAEEAFPAGAMVAPATTRPACVVMSTTRRRQHLADEEYVMNEKSTTTRRGFLGALAGAAPLALVPAAAAPAARAASPAHEPVVIRHNPQAAPGDCYCAACGAARDDAREAVANHPLVLDAFVAVTGAIAALERLDREHCTDAYCDACLDADAFAYTFVSLFGTLDSETIHTDDFCARVRRAESPDTSLAPLPGAVVALYDLLDALYDLTAGHPAGGWCWPCEMADRGAYLAESAVCMLEGELLAEADDDGWLAVRERELLSDRRKVERARVAEAAGVELPRHTARHHAVTEDDIASLEESIARSRLLAAGRGGRRA
jgi:hypothetical protein